MAIVNPQFTIIIPTLNRPDTLLFTIKTVIKQVYNNFSILVSDNFSDVNVKQVVDSFEDSRIVYIRTPHRMPMSNHWEFALTHVTQGYVTILGDDDGLVNDSLSKAARLINKYKVDVIGWKFANFNWKGLPPYFMIPMNRYYRIIDAQLEIKKIFKEGNIYKTIEFPSLYGGFVNIELIKKIKLKFGGVFFHSRIPDFFSGAIIASNVKKYIRLDFPLSINATSKHSTGYAVLNSKNDQTYFNALAKGDDNIPFHPKLVFIRSIAVPIAEAMLQVKELEPSFPEVNFKQLIKHVVAEASNTSDISSFESILKGIEQIATNNGLHQFYEAESRNMNFNPKPVMIKQKFSPVSNTLYFNTTNSKIDTVEDAADLLQELAPTKHFLLRYGVQKFADRSINLMQYIIRKFLSKNKNNI